MKTIIISDIPTGKESIIPYGLNIGKFTETEVEILHIIDPREHQGVQSSLADSQTISHGNKLSHMDILQREKSVADKALDKLLSKEASRLNYPLKINVNTETDYLEKSLKTVLRKNPESILIASSDPGDSTISSLNELLSIAKELKEVVFIIPPGQKFHELREVMLITDYSEGNYLQMKQVFTWLKPFDPLIQACAIVSLKKFVDMELRGKAWKQVVKNYLDPSSALKTSLIKKGGDNRRTLLDYVRRNNPDLVALPRKHKAGSGYKFFSKNNTKELIESLNRPILLY